MFRHGTAHTVRRRFLHAPSSCRVGCRVCLGSLVSGRGHPSGRRAVFGASAALLTIGTLLVAPPGRDGLPWRDQAAVLATQLARLEPTDGTAAGTLSYDLELLGFSPVPTLPAARQEPPDDDEDSSDDGGSDEDSSSDEDTGAEDTGAEDEENESGTDETEPGEDTASEEDGDDTGSTETGEADTGSGREEPDGGAAREPGGSDSMGTGWEDTAQELADLLAEFGTDDEAAQALADALAEAGFAPSTGSGSSRGAAGAAGSRDAGSRPAGTGGGGGEVLWDADVETGDLSQFEGGGDDPQQVGAPEPEIVDGRDGNHAVSFTIPGGGNRNEVLPDAEFSDGDERWFGFSSLLEDGFPVDAAWQVIVQWKNDGTGSPPLSLNVENGEYLLHGGYSVGKEWTESIGPATAGEWVDWVVYVEFEGGAGRVDVWQDGEQVVDGLVPDGGTLYPGKDSYLKIGYYRDTGIGEDGTVVFDNWKMGTSYDAVAPGGAAAGPSANGPSPDDQAPGDQAPDDQASGDRPSDADESGSEGAGSRGAGGSAGGPGSDGSRSAPSAERRTATDPTAGADTRPRSSVPFVQGR